MKLQDLTAYPVLEIVKGPSQSIGLKDPKLLVQLKPTGTDIEGFPLFALHAGDEIAFALKDQNNDMLTILVGMLITDFPGEPKQTIRVERTFTPPQHRNKGYSTALYDGLARSGYRVISDLQLSPEAIAVWSKLRLLRNVTSFDTETKQPTDKDPMTNINVCFVLEAAGHPQSALLFDNKMFTL